MNDKTVGIVLQKFPYKDKDEIIHVLSKGYGKIAFVCKGLMKVDSKNSSSCQQFNVSEFTFDYNETKSMFLMKTASCVDSNRKLMDNIDSINYASLICEITNKLLIESEPNETTYEHLKIALTKMIDNPYLASALYITYLFAYFGISPYVDGCVVCGDSKVNSVSINEGGFLCRNCSISVEHINCSLDELTNFRLLNKATFDNYDILNKSLNLKFSDIKILVDYFVLHTGINLNSWRFIEGYSR